MNFIQDRIHKAVSKDISNRGIDMSIRPRTFILYGKWQLQFGEHRSRNWYNKAERGYKHKTQPDLKIDQVLTHLKEKYDSLQNSHWGTDSL